MLSIAAPAFADPWSVKVFPSGHLFVPLSADLREPAFRVGLWGGSWKGRVRALGLVNVGESFGIVRFMQGEDRVFQIDLAGAVYTQFDLPRIKEALINIDYRVSAPVTYRSGDVSTRVAITHQSSHVGDEYLAVHGLDVRSEFHFESLEILTSFDLGGLRVYGGGECLFRQVPRSMGNAILRAGIEYRTTEPVYGFARGGTLGFLAAADVAAWQGHGFIPALTAAFGLELFAPDASPKKGRTLRLMLEFYRGFFPFGQFSAENSNLIAGGASVSTSL